MMLMLAGCGKVDLLSNLPEEANEIFSLMQQHHIPMSKKPGLELGWTIVLKNSDDFSRAEKIFKNQWISSGAIQYHRESFPKKWIGILSTGRKSKVHVCLVRKRCFDVEQNSRCFNIAGSQNVTRK
jgi:hypothetical protein